MRNSSLFVGAMAVATTILSLTPAGAATARPDAPADQPAGESIDAPAGQATTTDVAELEATPSLEPVILGRTETALSSAFVAAAASPSPADEATFVSMINQLRNSQGLNSLALDSDLTTQARQWTQVMDDADRLHHASDLSAGISADWQVLGENVGVHSIHDLDALFQAFVNSPTHYANLVDPRFTHLGVGVIQADDGYIWTTHRFMAATSSTPAPTQPPTTAAPVTQPPATQPAPQPSPSEPATTAAPSTEPPTTAPSTKPPTTPSSADPSTATPSSSDAQPVTDATPGNGQGNGTQASAGGETSSSDATDSIDQRTGSTAAADSTDENVESRRPELDTDLIGEIIDEVAHSGL